MTRFHLPLLLVACLFGWSVGAQDSEKIEAHRQTTPAPTPDHTNTGSILLNTVLQRGNESIPGDDSVIWIPGLPADGQTTQAVTIAQRDKQFDPRLAIVSVASTVDFPNHDRIFHNVFSLSSAKEFDLGLYRKGKSKAMTFDQPGLVQVYCNIHPHMAAYLMIVDSRHHGLSDERGGILLDGVPPGQWTVEGWNVRAGFFSTQVTVQPGQQTETSVELNITSWRETPHLNKHGKEYPPPDDDDFRY